MTSNLFHTKYGIFEDKFMTYIDYFLSKVALISTDVMFSVVSPENFTN